MATELRKLEQMVKDIHQEMLFVKKTEEEMRNLNGMLIAAAVSCESCFVAELMLSLSVQEKLILQSGCYAEATNERVAWFSISSLLVCAGLGAWQLWHLRQFFKRKKIL